MARFERDLGASAAAPLSLAQLLDLLGPAAGGEVERTGAVARFVAGAEGWEEALRELGGTFAETEQGLTDGQAE